MKTANTKRTPKEILKHYAKRYFIDAMGAMAQGLFASLLIGTILNTLGTQLWRKSATTPRACPVPPWPWPSAIR